MQALVFYDSKYGNTEKIARAIADGLGEHIAVRTMSVSASVPLDVTGVDLLVVGGPTQRHGASPALRAMLDDLQRGSIKGVQAATFDTRYRMARFLTGSAAKEAAKRLSRAGCRLVVPAESFFMERDLPPKGQKRRHELEELEPGEMTRAREWGQKLFSPPDHRSS